MNAFIFINAEIGKLWKIAEQTLEIKSIKLAHPVTGQYDVIAYAEFLNVPHLSEIIDEIQLIEGVIRTTTAIAMVPRLPE